MTERTHAIRPKVIFCGTCVILLASLLCVTKIQHFEQLAEILASEKPGRMSRSMSTDNCSVTTRNITWEGLPCYLPVGKERCDAECRKLKALLDSPSWKLERAFIYVLTKKDRQEELDNLLSSLEMNFKFRYPIVLFHEDNLEENATRLAKLTPRHPLIFQLVNLSSPSFLDPNFGENSSCAYSRSYKNMCRFHAKCIYQQPAMQVGDYFWRLDDDSCISAPVSYDVFKHMREEGYLYGYRRLLTLKIKICIQQLWPVSEIFVKMHKFTPTFFQSFPVGGVFFNNFELSKASLWYSKLYRDYIEFIDSSLGFYLFRWGDAPVKTIFVSMAVKKDQLRWFCDIAYWHKVRANMGQFDFEVCRDVHVHRF